MTPNELRQKVLRKRKSLNAAQIEKMSAGVFANFTQVFKRLHSKHHRNFHGCRVAVYRPTGSEVKLTQLKGWLIDQGAKICYPRIVDPNRKLMEMVFAPPEEENWKKGPTGIMEPDRNLEPVNPRELDVIFVPGVVFGASGERLGRGAGYFDRYLAMTRPDCMKISLAFDFQVVDQVLQQEWDVNMDWVVTESREIRLGTVKTWFSARTEAS